MLEVVSLSVSDTTEAVPDKAAAEAAGPQPTVEAAQAPLAVETAEAAPAAVERQLAPAAAALAPDADAKGALGAGAEEQDINLPGLVEAQKPLSTGTPPVRQLPADPDDRRESKDRREGKGDVGLGGGLSSATLLLEQQVSGSLEGGAALDRSGTATQESIALSRTSSLQQVIARVSTVDLSANGWSWLTNPHVCWRHPVARIVVAWLIFVLDMLLYAEDPVNDSHVECNLPGLGHSYVFLLVWPSSAGLLLLRLFLLLVAAVVGAVVGNFWVHHRLLRNCCGLEMFQDSNGSWLVMGVCCIGAFFAGCLIYNLLLWSSPDDQITGATGMEMRIFGKITQICSVTMDLVAILMVTDSVLQDRVFYPRWASRLKWLWMDVWQGLVRVVAVWVMAIAGVSLTVWGILNTGKDEDDFRWNDTRFGGLTEIARALLMSLVIFCDIFTVVQDWNFPSFAQPMDIPLDKQVYIAGTWVTEIRCDLLSRCAQRCLACLPPLPRCCRACGCLSRCAPDLSWLHITITGPWLTYGPLLLVMLIDLFCTRTQIIYEPENFGQYADPSGQVWTILDEAYLLQAYDHGMLRDDKKDLITYAARRDANTGVALSASAATDIMLNSRYTGSSLKYLAAVPGFVLMAIFVLLVWAANKRRTLLVAMATFVGNAATLAGNTLRRCSLGFITGGDSGSQPTLGGPADRPDPDPPPDAAPDGKDRTEQAPEFNRTGSTAPSASEISGWP